jgi:hypothetical protein
MSLPRCGSREIRSSHSPSNSFPRVGLYFSDFSFLRSGTTRNPGGVPIRSRAIAFTAFTAVNVFFLLLLGIYPHLAIACPC